MWINLILILALVGLTGCASTKKLAASNDLQTRYAELERQLADKDTEIEGLKDELQNLTEETSRKESSETSSVSTSPKENYKKDGIIRIDVSPHKVQLALQNAGFYNGPIDGKVGEKTKKAISEFQKANSLNADGIIGRKTWDTLKTYLN